MVSVRVTSGCRGFLEDRTSFFDVVSVEADDEWLGGLVTEDLESLDNAVGHSVTRGDSAEDVDED